MRLLLLLIAIMHALLGVYCGLVSVVAAHRAWQATGTGGPLMPLMIAVAVGIAGAVFFRGCREFLRRRNRPIAMEIAVTTAFVIWGLGGLASVEAMRMNLFPLLGPAGSLVPFAMWSYLAHAIYRRVLRPMAERGA